MLGKGEDMFAYSRIKNLKKIILAPTKSFHIQENQPQTNINLSFMNKTIWSGIYSHSSHFKFSKFIKQLTYQTYINVHFI